MADQVRHICPRTPSGLLPAKIADDASSSRIEEVCKWLSEGGDINAYDDAGMTLLHYACKNEQEAMVKKLLEYPEIHLNVRKDAREGLTPLAAAACSGHHRIVDILLNAKNPKCVADPSLYFMVPVRNIRTSSIMLAAQGRHWTTVRIILQHYKNMRELEAFNVLCRATEDYEFDIFEEIFSRCHPYKDNDFGNLIYDVYSHGQWEMVKAVFRKNVFYNNDSSKRLLYTILVHKEWSKLEEMLALMDDVKVKINVNVVEAVLGKKERMEIEKLTKEEEAKEDNGEEVRAGTLLVAAIGGTTPEVAGFLINEISEYSDKTLENALILSSMNCRMEFLPLLLQRTKFSYQILCRARFAASLLNKFDATTLIMKVVEERAKGLSNNGTGADADR